LTKEWRYHTILLMALNSYRLPDLEAALASRIDRRMSFLIEATSFRVGTFLSSLFLASFSIGGSL
jgi:hypothetical protein